MTGHKNKHILSTLLFVVFLAGIIAYFVFYFDFYAFFDKIKANRFEPETEVISLEENLNLTERGRDLYYALSPKIDEAEKFNQECKNVTGVESGFLLGCYLSDRGNEKIIVFNAGSNATEEQKQLFDYDSSKKVTMVHELLHGAYERRHWYQSREMVKELRRISKQIAEGCESSTPLHTKDCLTIKADLKNYSKITESELYARLGSEIQLNKLPPNLAQDFQKYLTDTTTIVEAYAKNREQEKNIKTNLENEKKKLDQEKNNVEYLTAQYYSHPTYSQYYAAKIAIDHYNQQVESYNNLVKLYNSTFIEQLDSKTAETITE